MPVHDIQTNLLLWGQAKNIRVNHEVQWDAITCFLFPNGGTFQSRSFEGTQLDRDIFENTGTRALYRSGAILEALFAPRHTHWQGVRSPFEEVNQRHEVQIYYDEVVQELFNGRENPATDFYGEKAIGYLSTSAYGNEAFFIDEILETQMPRYEQIPLQHIWPWYDHTKTLGGIYRLIELTAWAAKTRFQDNVPKAVRDAMQQNQPLKPLQFLQVVQPRPNTNPNPDANTPAKELPLESVIIELSEKDLVEELGYHEMPFMFARADLVPGESYGRGWGHQALPDDKTLQEMEKHFLGQGAYASNPLILATEDGPFGVGQRKIKARPGQFVFGGLDDNGRPTMAPFQNGANIAATETMMEQKREAIKDTFNTGLLALLDDKTQTLGEVMVKLSERGQLIAPLAGKQHKEMFGPMTRRELGIAFRAGRLPAMPEALIETGGQSQLFFTNKATEFVQADEVVALQRVVELTDQIATHDPTIALVPNWHALFRKGVDAMGLGASLLNSPEEVDASIQAQLAQQQEQQAAEQMPGIAKGTKDLVDAGVVSPDEAGEALAAQVAG